MSTKPLFQFSMILKPAAIDALPEKLKADTRFAHDNVRRFAEFQKSTAELISSFHNNEVWAGDEIM